MFSKCFGITVDIFTMHLGGTELPNNGFILCQENCQNSEWLEQLEMYLPAWLEVRGLIMNIVLKNLEIIFERLYQFRGTKVNLGATMRPYRATLYHYILSMIWSKPSNRKKIVFQQSKELNKELQQMFIGFGGEKHHAMWIICFLRTDKTLCNRWI